MLFIDIETYSGTDLAKTGVYRYVEDPSFRILMAAWAVDDGTVQIATTKEDILNIPGLWDNDVLKVAHNAAFERVCFSRFDGLPPGEYLDPRYWHDTMAIAAEKGYPLSLGELAISLGAEEKDEAGKRLINLFSKPNRKGDRVLPEEKPEEWLEFMEYCMQDVETLRDIHQRLGDWPTETEREIFLSDQRINDKGIRIDIEMAARAVAASQDNALEQELELMNLTGLANPNSQMQMLGWCQKQGLPMGDLKAETVKEVLSGDLTTQQRRVLELRQELALVASKKYTSALASVSADGRLRGGFRFFGAHTGRWAGRGVQLHNLPRAQLETEADTDAAITDLGLGLGADSQTLKALVRALFVGPFTVVDYASIEARVIAWMANETWALDAFRAGRDIYVETAERMGGLTRAQGKVAVLALGYNGGIGSLRAMGAQGGDQQLQTMVYQWRKANPAIVGLWSEMEEAFRNGGRVGPHIKVIRDGDSRLVRLPSGRDITYHGVTFGQRTSFADPRRRGARTDTYGGRLIENATQAIARDVLGEALVRLHEVGYDLVGHVHDEILVEGVGTHSVRVVKKIMIESPTWADGLPIDAAGFTCRRYRKG